MRDSYARSIIKETSGSLISALIFWRVRAQEARRAGRYALCTMCIGFGQGIAVIVECV
jgi:acetyl-CoA acetyltransferase